MAVMHQNHHRRAHHPAGEEGDAVLGVDHHVGIEPGHRSTTEPAGDDRRERPRVHAEPATAARDPDAVTDLRGRRTRVAGRPQGHAHAVADEFGPDALEVAFAAATLRVVGVAPAQQQHLADGRGGITVGDVVRLFVFHWWPG